MTRNPIRKDPLLKYSQCADVGVEGMCHQWLDQSLSKYWLYERHGVIFGVGLLLLCELGNGAEMAKEGSKVLILDHSPGSHIRLSMQFSVTEARRTLEKTEKVNTTERTQTR